jgi:hypothetical protein
VSRRLTLPFAASIALLALTAPLAAQAPAAPPRRWSGGVQANGTLLFGNAEQRVVGGRATLARADSTIEVDGSLQMLYGDATAEDGPREVTKRLWLATVSADWRPRAALSPFVIAAYESNLEKRVATRTSAGVGAKRTFVRSARSEASLSVALLDERTVARLDADARAEGDPRVVRVTRWSARARVQHGLDRRLRLTHVTFYRPRVRTAGDFVIQSTSEARYAMTRALNASLSLLVNHDSEARGRGARVATDGQLLFGLGASW